MTDLTLKAAAGVRVPQEDNARRYITDAQSVTVPDSAYYQRRLRDGDVILVNAEAPIPAKTPVTAQPDTGTAASATLKTASKEVTDGQS
ncbi:DUF2635 domain-containing protein [Obesumbacterium proteus]|uniref:DUF2635 domain-containing protein n=1 Tax=Obesumbacterium proteus ATCC 12841 TaxID=1354268 RepID=A0AA91EE24_9GAMM|nr:DUF2635 domain-containing protein [Obesumbacterium proteus]AMO79717.1 hypothetical protein DSM2777_00745 [Obesumbacterium proteus]OAT58979.1 hypothetical protein M993_02282 [Obesumbacterium proteus ATCC 12841]